MRAPAPASPYEVYCPRCNVSFPVGTRVCLHCGQPIRRPLAQAIEPGQPPALEDEMLEELPLRAVKISPLTIAWLLAGVATIAYRACS